MTYGKSKERDMVRSILPSTRRKSARDLKRAHNKANRHAVKQTLHHNRDALACENRDLDLEYEFFNHDAVYADMADADGWYDRRIKEMMWDRRLGDKVAPIIRWAEAQVEDVRPEDRLSWLQARMPDNLAVRHAISHIKYSDSFPEENPYEYGWRQYGMTDEEREWVRAASYAQAYEDLYRICCGPLGRFNYCLPKFAYRDVYGGRELNLKGWELDWDGEHRKTYRFHIERLQGVHHIEEFLANIAAVGPSFNGYGHYRTGQSPVQHAIDATLRWAYGHDSYLDYDVKGAHGRKAKV